MEHDLRTGPAATFCVQAGDGLAWWAWHIGEAAAAVAAGLVAEGGREIPRLGLGVDDRPTCGLRSA